MFDILKDKQEGDEPEPAKEKREEASPPAGKMDDKLLISQPLCFPKEILKSAAEVAEDKERERAEKEDASLVSKKLISAVRQHGVDNQEKAAGIYESAIAIITRLLAKVKNNEDLNPHMDTLNELLDTIFNQLVMGDNILTNIYEKKIEGPFLPSHIVNVMILSSVIGLNMGFNKSRLSHLGLASVFYDVGVYDMRELIEQPRVLTGDERKIIKTHVGRSLRVVERISNFNDIVKETILMHHERVSGSGYPHGIRRDSINPYAKILGLVDTYEAITHDRPYRQGMNSHKAVRFIMGSIKNDFDADVMKIFINKMSVYPIGSIVALDTGEVARVTSVQPGSPLRPVVMILKDPSGANVKERIIIDLSKQDFPVIKERP